MNWNFSWTYKKIITNGSYTTIRDLLDNQLFTEFSTRIFQLRTFANSFKKFIF